MFEFKAIIRYSNFGNKLGFMEFIKDKKNIIFTFFVIFTIIIGVVLRIVAFYANDYYLTMDECHSLAMVKYPFSFLFSRFEQGANFLPLYSVMLKFIYELVGVEPFYFKLSSLFAGITSVFIFYFLAKEIFKNKILILFSLVVFILNYNLLYFSSIIKPYIFDACFTMLIILFALKIRNRLLDNSLSYKFICGLSILSVLILWFSTPSIPVFYISLGILIIEFLIKKNYKALKQLILIVSITSFFVLVEYFVYISQIHSDTALKSMWLSNDFFFYPNSYEALNALINFSFYRFFWWDSALDVYFTNYVVFIFVLIFILGILNFIREKNIVSLIIPSIITFFLVLSYLKIYPFCNRLIIFLIPLFIIVLFKAFDFKYYSKKYLVFPVLALFFTGFLLSYINLESPLTKNYQMKNILNEKVYSLKVPSNDDVILALALPYFYIFDNPNIINIEPNGYIENNEINIEFDSLLDGKKTVYLFFFLLDTPMEKLSLYSNRIIQNGYSLIDKFDGDPVGLREYSYYKFVKN